MLVSVIIVTRNRSESLLRCIKSVLMQDYKPIELIVVDNASADDSISLVQSHYPTVTLLPQSVNTGAPEGRNIGIRHAKGELCVCLDDDAELIDTTAIQQSIDHFSKNKNLGCLSMRVLDQQDQIIPKLIPRRDRKVFEDDRPAALFSATGCVFRRSAFFAAGTFWKELGPYFGEEPELSYRLLDKGYDILNAAHISVRHHTILTEIAHNKSRRIYYGTRNTPWIALRNLPWYSVFGLTILTWGYFFLAAIYNRQLLIFFKAVISSLHYMPAVFLIRKPLSKNTKQVIWQHSGLILF